MWATSASSWKAPGRRCSWCGCGPAGEPAGPVPDSSRLGPADVGPRPARAPLHVLHFRHPRLPDHGLERVAGKTHLAEERERGRVMGHEHRGEFAGGGRVTEPAENFG